MVKKAYLGDTCSETMQVWTHIFEISVLDGEKPNGTWSSGFSRGDHIGRHFWSFQVLSFPPLKKSILQSCRRKAEHGDRFHFKTHSKDGVAYTNSKLSTPVLEFSVIYWRMIRIWKLFFFYLGKKKINRNINLLWQKIISNTHDRLHLICLEEIQ